MIIEASHLQKVLVSTLTFISRLIICNANVCTLYIQSVKQMLSLVSNNLNVASETTNHSSHLLDFATDAAQKALHNNMYIQLVQMASHSKCLKNKNISQ